MMAQFLQHLLSLGIAWLLNLVLANLFWVFAFFATAYLVLEGKRTLYGFVALCGLIFVAIDFEAGSGLVIFGAGFLAFNYVTKIALLAFVENIPRFSKRLPLFEELHFLATLIIFNFFLR